MNTEQLKSKLENKIAFLDTSMLLTICKEMNLKTEPEEIIISTMVERELEKRLSTRDFLALMNELEAELDAA